MPRPETQKQNRIGRRLFMQSLQLALVMTILLSVFQVWLNYREFLSSIQTTVQQIKQVQAGGIATALWNYSTPELASQTAGIIHFPFITYAEVRDSDRVITQAGTKLASNYHEEMIPLVHEEGDTRSEIGMLVIQIDQTKVYQELLDQVTRIFIFQAINVFIVILIFLLLIDRQVTRHLTAAARFFRSFDINNLDIPLKLDKRQHSDEIDALVGAFNAMRKNLSTAYQQQFESERKHSTLLSNLPGMVFRCLNDPYWTMELVSAGCLDLTGYSPAEIIGNKHLSYSELIHPDDRAGVQETIQSGVDGKTPYEMSYRILTRDGQLKWVWERGIGVYNNSHALIAVEGFITDITERKQQERELEAIATVSYALRTARTQAEILPVILEQTMKVLNADGGELELIDPHNDDAVVVLAQGAFAQMLGTRIPHEKGLNSYIRASGKPYLNNLSFDDPMCLEFGIDLACHATGGVPLVADGQLIGFLWIGRKTRISENALRVLTAIADIAANAIHRVVLYQQTEQRLLQLIGLRKIDLAINSSQDLAYTLNVLLEQTIALLQVDAASIYLLDPAVQKCQFKAGLGFQYPLEQELEMPATGSALAQKSLVKICDLALEQPEPGALHVMHNEGFHAYFAVPLIAKEDVLGILQVYRRTPYRPDTDWSDFFETLGGQAAIVVSEANLLHNLKHTNQELQLAYEDTIEGWSNALDLRDKETEGHSRRVTQLSIALARQLGVQGEDLLDIRRGALLHDIGKMGVPDRILLKEGKLDTDEWEIMRKHPQNAYNLLYPISYLRSSLDIPYCHHEKWDGSGYPRQLKGTEIPLAARIFAVVDVWDALTSDRPYRKALSPDEALQYITENSGAHFDPAIVDLFVQSRAQSS